MDGQKINNHDATSAAPAACAFNNRLYLFWKENGPSNGIYYTSSGDGQTWPAGQRINDHDATSAAPAVCVFNNHLYLFWKENGPSNGIYYTSWDGQSSLDGQLLPAGRKINNRDATSDAPAACVFNDRLYLFWKANDSSNSINYTSWDGQTLSRSRKINNRDATSAAPAACVFDNEKEKRLYLFWKANDSSNSINYTSSGDGQTWPAGRKINNLDATSAAPAACVFKYHLLLFWKANDSSNSIVYTRSGEGDDWFGSQKINDHDATSAALAACAFPDEYYLFWKATNRENSLCYAVSSY
jgi:hypothetical protein